MAPHRGGPPKRGTRKSSVEARIDPSTAGLPPKRSTATNSPAPRRRRRRRRRRRFPTMVLRQGCACHRRDITENMYKTAAKCRLATSRAAHICPTPGSPPTQTHKRNAVQNTQTHTAHEQGSLQPEKRRRPSLGNPPLTPSIRPEQTPTDL